MLVRLNAGDVVSCAQDRAHGPASSKETDVTYLAIFNETTVWMELRPQEAHDLVGGKLAKK